MKSVFSVIDTSLKNTSRNYSDVRLSNFDCGCRTIAAKEDPQRVLFIDICNFHRDECELSIGKRLTDKIVLSRYQSF